jgi:hypothetical protein
VSAQACASTAYYRVGILSTTASNITMATLSLLRLAGTGREAARGVARRVICLGTCKSAKPHALVHASSSMLQGLKGARCVSKTDPRSPIATAIVTAIVAAADRGVQVWPLFLSENTHEVALAQEHDLAHGRDLARDLASPQPLHRPMWHLALPFSALSWLHPSPRNLCFSRSYRRRETRLADRHSLRCPRNRPL